MGFGPMFPPQVPGSAGLPPSLPPAQGSAHPPRVPGSAGLPPSLPPAQGSGLRRATPHPPRPRFRLFAAACSARVQTRDPSATMSTSSVPGAPNLSSVDLMLRYIDLVRKSPWSDYFQMKAIAVVGCRFLLTETDFAEVPPG